MKRRRFLQTGALAWAGLSVAGRAARAEPMRDAPSSGATIISTWDFGLAPHETAWGLLADKGHVLDAVQRGVMEVESDPRVESVGYGGLPNIDGVVQLDAALMDGKTLDCGAVAALEEFGHPVAVARKVMDETPHVLLVGEGAHRFALEHGFEKQKLLTESSRKQWEERSGKSAAAGEKNHDTIGMVACDGNGRMAAACTTSGLAWKLAGRVGDSPLVGHGLYCDDEAGGAAATGMGEEVIKVCGSYQVVEFMRQGMEPGESIQRVLQRIRRRKRQGKPPEVAFVALRADGAIGYDSMYPGFDATVTRNGKHEILKSPHLLD